LGPRNHGFHRLILIRCRVRCQRRSIRDGLLMEIFETETNRK
jgi:hypothetical protein